MSKDVKADTKSATAAAATPVPAGLNSTQTPDAKSEVSIHAAVKPLESQLLAWRRYLHAHPELSFQEFETAKYIAAQLRAIDSALVIHESIGKTGIVAVLKGTAAPAKAPHCIARLPITEESSELNTKFQYKSVNVGAMHACGHDGHMTMMLGAIRVLVSMKAKMPSNFTVKFIFQPAEEGFAGAAAMLADGAMDDGKCGPKVDEIFGLHLWNYQNVGTVGVKTGPLMAASDRFGISIKGKGGHGAVPQGTNDCIVAASNLVIQLHSIVARNINPIDSAVLTVGQINAGVAPNVIADSCELTGTVRTFSPGTRTLMIDRMNTVCAGIAKSFGVSCQLQYHEGYPCVNNKDNDSVTKVIAASSSVVGADGIVKPESTMGAEDYSYFLNHVKRGAFFFVGCSLSQLKLPLCSSRHVDGPCSTSETTGEERPHHRSDFDFDERVLAIGASIWVRLIENELKALGSS